MKIEEAKKLRELCEKAAEVKHYGERGQIDFNNAASPEAIKQLVDSYLKAVEIMKALPFLNEDPALKRINEFLRSIEE